VAQALLETLLAVIDRLQIDRSPVEGKNQILAVTAEGRTDGLPIVSMKVIRIIEEHIDVVDPGGDGKIEYLIHVLTRRFQVFGAEPDHANFQSCPA
jgi:hypothetical protein